MSKITLSITLSLLLGATAVLANSDNMAESLMKLRSQVEQLDSSISEEKESHKATMQSLLRQKDDLESVVAREDLKIKQLEAELAKVKQEITDGSKNSDGLKPLLLSALDLLEANIQSSLPFKTQERVADITQIKEQILNDLITPQKGLALTWNAYSDAIRMTKENGLFKQTIKIGNEEKLAEIARIGTMMMYFKTPDNKVGYASKDTKGWYYKEALSTEEKEQILSLFDAFKKQIRTGYFNLPNAITMGENK
ncbi:MAG TPA: hypothetical protein CFH84_00885 [Sulfurimonas sp. UBA12504]|nr:MAG: hypothetical protein A2019_01695 [Sulfurimonas sp. GWF2_37_8]DAB31015.1 MAG TPA: hypothetical protein CFH84_00885 [Sulfurimonas sp. UBA12504]